MKTQLSRNSFKADKRYSGVYQQQGRMITDADWNNLVDVLKGNLAEALKDVVGNGSPRTGHVKITDDRQIQPGDLYVDGLRAVLPDTGEGPIDINAQPDFPGAPELPDSGTDYVIYADVWERSLTSLEDPELRDAGLNGADTCTRTRTMLQIKICPPDVDPESDILRQGDAELILELHANQTSDDPCDPCAGEVGAGDGRVGNYLFRLEVHDTQWTGGHLAGLTLKWSSENGAEQYEALEEVHMPPGFVVSSGYVYEFFDMSSETHLGVHLNPEFDPTVPELTTAYVIPDGATDPKAYVRRWDGYCKLVHDGSGWSLVEGIDKGVNLSAPGVPLGKSMRVNLEALKLELVLDGRTFLTGDYWLAPMREAEHDPGSIVLEGDPPEGTVHHYLRLARVTGGIVERFDDDADEADKRRHNFPPLTDLQAFDVGYRADCNADKGLFQKFAGTVKEALDKVCEIQAGNVGFTETCDKSIYKGQTVATVQDALQLLCKVQADQIGYERRAECTFLNRPEIETVQEALDALCIRPSGGGCKITVGEGGQFATLNQAITALRSQQVDDICLCLLPGSHRFDGIWENKSERFDLSISGCGAGTEVVFENPVTFIGLTSLKLANFSIDAMKEKVPLSVERCTEVEMSNLHHVGLAAKNSLIQVTGGERIRLEENILEAYSTEGLETPQQVFAFDPELVSLYEIVRRDEFLAPAGGKAEGLARLDEDERVVRANRILIQLKTVQTTLAEEVAYLHLVETLKLPTVDAQTLLDRLREVRDQAHHATAGRGVIFMDALASVALEDNTIFGSIGFYGLPGESDLNQVQFEQLVKMLEPPPPVRIRSLSSGASLQAWDNRITKLTVGSKMIDTLKEMNPDTEDEELIQGLYRTALFESNIIAGFGNQLLFENLTLSSNDFQGLEDPIGWEDVGERIGWGVGRTVIYTGNRVQRTQYTDADQELKTVGGGKMPTAARNQAVAANLPVNSWQ